MLLAGEVSLTTISLVSKVITSENKAELLPKLRGASRSDVEKLLASMQGGGREIRDRVRPVAGKAVARQGVTAAESQGSLGQVAKETEKGMEESTEQGTEQRTARTSSGGGCGRFVDKDRKRSFAIARGSAMECAAISDLLIHVEPSLTENTQRSKNTLLSIVKILSTVILK